MILEIALAIVCIVIVPLLMCAVLIAIIAVLYSPRWDEEREAAWREYLEEKKQADEG